MIRSLLHAEDLTVYTLCTPVRCLKTTTIVLSGSLDHNCVIGVSRPQLCYRGLSTTIVLSGSLDQNCVIGVSRPQLCYRGLSNCRTGKTSYWQIDCMWSIVSGAM